MLVWNLVYFIGGVLWVLSAFVPFGLGVPCGSDLLRLSIGLYLVSCIHACTIHCVAVKACDFVRCWYRHSSEIYLSRYVLFHPFGSLGDLLNCGSRVA